ncbi:hypothetical protein ElyMa_003705900 [Elysia marginata]|uniref:Uncharacterized protein n=1 Tax=Elysia marginata TaxID=1093978 RepID=A0AAV4F2B4_9GAST|nr:hypothetical protein ElyMa_003705900 [Elysia marginata]
MCQISAFPSCPAGYVYLYGELGLGADQTSSQPANIFGAGKLKVVGGSSLTATKSFNLNKVFDTRVHPYSKPSCSTTTAGATAITTPSVSNDTILVLPTAKPTDPSLCLPSAPPAAAVASPDILASAQHLSDVQQVGVSSVIVTTF